VLVICRGDNEGWSRWLAGRLLEERLDEQTFAKIFEILDAFEKAEKDWFAPPRECSRVEGSTGGMGWLMQ
jgi:hypothetical protein